MARYQFCIACIEIAQAAHDAGAKELPDVELAVASQLVHDGTRYVTEFLCERHIGATIELAQKCWGFTLLDRVMDIPYNVN